jgi:putative ABC transport system permease protein
MARAKLRFGLLIGAIALLVFLILFQQALRDGLLTSFTGAIEHQTAPVLVYSTDGRRSLQSSSLTPEQEAQVRAVPGVAAAGRIGQSTVSVRAAGAIKAAAIIGYERRDLGAPEDLVAGRYPTADGEGIANETDASLGFGLGDVVQVAPGGYRIRIVGQSSDTNIQASPTVFVRYPSWEQVVLTANPDARTPLPNALGLAPESGVSPDELVARVDATSPDVEALTRADAASKAPGVAQVSRSFLVIFLLYGLVVPLVIGLFFLIITLQKARTLTLLRAIGARSRTLVWALMVQVLVVAGLGIALGTLLFLPVSFLRVGSLPLRFDVGAVAGWALGILVLGIASSWFSARRVLRIEPAEALSGGGPAA